MVRVPGKFDAVVLTTTERDRALARALEGMSVAVFKLTPGDAAEVCFESWPKVLVGDAAATLERAPDGKCLLERLGESGSDSLRVLFGGDFLGDDARERVGRDLLVHIVVPGREIGDICRAVNDAVEAVNESYMNAVDFRRVFSTDSGFRKELDRRSRETETITRVLA